MKHMANIITISRLISSLSLFLIEPLSILFYILYIYCGISDILDGLVARKTKTTSQAGEILDSLSDAVFLIVALIRLIPQLFIPPWIWKWVIVIAVIRLISWGIGFIQYDTFASLHTYMNKISGFLLFCFPLVYHIINIQISGLIVCSFILVSAIEELIIMIKEKELNRNIKSLIHFK